jgi:FkbM family methyltransferase
VTITLAQHPAFAQFDVRNVEANDAFHVNFVGQKANPEFGLLPGYRHDYPVIDDEAFEWIAVLESVLQARGTYTAIELGAGYGRWLITALCAARQKHLDLKFQLIGVEAEPTHFRWMRQHFMENDVDPDEHTLIKAVVNATGRSERFFVGHSDAWWGQSIVPDGQGFENFPSTVKAFPNIRIVEVRAVRLGDLLQPLADVNLVDMDIQGAELEVISSSIDAMTIKVRRAYVSTHSPPIHASIARLFTDAGWTLREMHGWKNPEDTCFGPLSFIDGIQDWINPHLS